MDRRFEGVAFCFSSRLGIGDQSRLTLVAGADGHLTAERYAEAGYMSTSERLEMARPKCVELKESMTYT
jgi:hypothetical protein